MPADELLPRGQRGAHPLPLGNVLARRRFPVRGLPPGLLLPPRAPRQHALPCGVPRGRVCTRCQLLHVRVRRPLHRSARFRLPRGVGGRRGRLPLPRGLLLRWRRGAAHRVRVPGRLQHHGVVRGPRGALCGRGVALPRLFRQRHRHHMGRRGHLRGAQRAPWARRQWERRRVFQHHPGRGRAAPHRLPRRRRGVPFGQRGWLHRRRGNQRKADTAQRFWCRRVW